MEKVLESLLKSLNQIEVRGRDNVIRLAACISTLEQLKKAFCESREKEGRDENE